MSAKGTDAIYASEDGPTGPFRFDRTVVDVFPDMIRRSVPGYGLVLEQIGILARRFVQPATVIYDLGCSLGAATLVLRHAIPEPDCRIIAVDSSPAMVAQCRRNVDRDPATVAVDVIEGDVTALPFVEASLMVMNYTLQFVDPTAREPLLTRICKALRPGGALVLSEKLRFEDPDEEARLTDLHHDFKRANGYSDLEIARKRAALEDVLRRDSWEEHRERLLACGFSRVDRWFQCYSFASILAVR